MTWTPSNEPDRFDEERLATLQPVRNAIARLQLPPLRFRKLNGILNALTMQIEDGGDNSSVNAHLLDALRAGVVHQVGETRAQPVLRAIDTFAEQEEARWKQVKAGTLPPIELDDVERLEDMVEEGINLLRSNETVAACESLLEAWKLVKQMKAPDIRSVEDFDAAHEPYYETRAWCTDLHYELQNAGLGDSEYLKRRLEFAFDFLRQFPDQDADTVVSFRRAQGEALWALGRRDEAERVYERTVDEFPNKEWAYIGWSDQYYLRKGAPNEYEEAEEILLRALDNPDLEHRVDVLDRLIRLYEEWDKLERISAIEQELDNLSEAHEPRIREMLASILSSATSKADESPAASASKKRIKGVKRKKRRKHK